MRRTVRGLLAATAALALMMLGLAGPASADTWPDRWDLSTCATEGAPSPVLDVPPSPGPLSYSVHLQLDGQDYTSYRVAPGSGEPATFTLPPIRPGEHQLAWGQFDGTYGPPTTIIAPQCPDGSPEPSGSTYPRAAADIAVTSRTECHPQSQELGYEYPALIVTFTNSGGDGRVQIYTASGGWTERVVPSGTSTWQSQGDPMVQILDMADEILLDVTLEPTCATESPAPSPSASSSTATVTRPAESTTSTQPEPRPSGPQTPAVVQTDSSVGAGAGLAPVAALLLTLGVGLVLGGRTLAPARRRRH